MRVTASDPARLQLSSSFGAFFLPILEKEWRQGEAENASLVLPLDKQNHTKMDDQVDLENAPRGYPANTGALAIGTGTYRPSVDAREIGSGTYRLSVDAREIGFR